MQYFKAGRKIPRKIGFFVALFVGLSKQKYFTEKEQGFSKFITKVCKESCQVQESRGSQDSVTPYVLPTAGSAASPTLAVSRPTSFVEVPGPSSLLWAPKLHLAFLLSSTKPETFKNSSYAQSLSLEALGDPPLGFLGLTLVQIAKKCENLEALESGNQDRPSKFN